ncbi:MAG: hypothetical protein HC863_02215 [Myxococcales bacterium]|nr:hypothetical protein [Myxococcales bacterium]
MLLPKILGEQGTAHSWRLHAYRGIGKVPPNLTGKSDPDKRNLLQELPRLLNGYGKSLGTDAVVVVVDTDQRDYKTFLRELDELLQKCKTKPKVTLFRLAVEEMEAWYLGDRAAVLAAYPDAKKAVLNRYKQDSVCGTWELLADAVYPGGAKAIKDAGWPLPGQIKHQFADHIGPHLDVRRKRLPELSQADRGGCGVLVA